MMSYKSNKIIAVDFDGTLCKNNWPEIGEPNEELISYLINRKTDGDKLILWTCRVDDMLQAAIEWCRGKGLIFDAVNENLPEIIESFGSDTRKIFANEYIDDRNTRPLKDDSYNILYLCDGREYMYTSDVSHAKNFVKGAYDLYWEKENNEEKTTDTNSYGESTENKCKYCTSHMNTLLEYCKCLYKLEGCEAGGLLHSLLDDNNMDDGSITDCMKLCLRHPEMEEAELGILICKEFLKMSMKERLAFDRLGYGWNGECYKKKDCEECSICNLSGEC